MEGRLKRVSVGAAGFGQLHKRGTDWVRIRAGRRDRAPWRPGRAQSLNAMGDSQPTASGTLYLNGQNLAINL